MKLCRLIIVLSIIAFIAPLTFLAAEEEHKPQEPKAVVSVNAWDFGEIIKGKTVSHIFSVSNQGGSILIFGRMYSSCACSTISASSKMLWPNESSVITIEYNSEEEPLGNFSKDFYIETNDPLQKEIKLTIKGLVSAQVSVQSKIVYLAYFHTPGCKKCEKAEKILEIVKKRYPNLNISKFNMAVRENRILSEAVARKYNVPEDKALIAPVVFLGASFLMGNDITQEKLEKLLPVYSKDGTFASWSVEKIDLQSAMQGIARRFKSFGLLVVLTAGFIDGINPCAFTTIVFFMSFLVFAGYKKREMILTGICFIAAVFLAYLLIGLGLFRFFQVLEIYSFLSRLLYIAIALLAVWLGVVSLYDYWKYKTTGNLDALKLQLPKLIKNMIHKVIRSEMADNSSLKFNVIKLGGSAFIAGFIVSLLESVCTGQVYLPTIVFVMGLPELRPKAFLYLIFYNLIFIVPLILVFLLALKGATSEKFASFAKTHLGTVKLITAGLFLGLGIFLLNLQK